MYLSYTIFFNFLFIILYYLINIININSLFLLPYSLNLIYIFISFEIAIDLHFHFFNELNFFTLNFLLPFQNIIFNHLKILYFIYLIPLINLFLFIISINYFNIKPLLIFNLIDIYPLKFAILIIIFIFQLNIYFLNLYFILKKITILYFSFNLYFKLNSNIDLIIPYIFHETLIFVHLKFFTWIIMIFLSFNSFHIIYYQFTLL